MTLDMAQRRQSEAFDYKTKYEESENQLKHLKDLAHKAVADYEELQRKYDQNQKQYDELKVRLQETEYQLEQLQQALEPACNEYRELQDLYTIENKCRAEAEKYAHTMVQENKKLKRQSQQLLEQISNATTFDPTQLKFDTIEEVEVDDSQIAQLKEKIEKLESLLESSRDRCHELEEERVMLHEKEHMQNMEIEKFEQTLKAANERISELERCIENYNTLSEQAVREHEELVEKYEQEKSLRNEAEKYASNMLSQKNAVVRESSVVLASAMSDKRLQDAFMQIEELQKSLENERNENAQKIKELEEKLEEGSSAKVHDLEQRLEVIIEESQAKSQQIKEMEEWKAKLEKECKDLTLKLDTAEQQFVPPPPPPPPPLPTSLFSLFRPAKKKVTNQKKPVDELVARRQSAFDKALKEMMDRIKKGDTLKSGVNRRRPGLQAVNPSAPEIGTANRSSAMIEMGQILSQLKMNRSKSIDEKRKHLTDEGQSDYEKIYNKIKGGTIGATTGSAIVSTTLARISEEKDADLKTSSNEKSSKPSKSPDRLSTDL